MQRYKLVLTVEALAEIQDAVAYYNNKGKGLGKRFYIDLDKQLKSLKTNPQHHSIRYNHIRFAHLHKFPYAAHYEITDQVVIILAVLCDYRDPDKYWKK